MHYLLTKKLWVHRFQMVGKLMKRLLLPGNDPSFLIIGAQKAGTTSLAFYLNQHPLINQSIRKEVHFFEKEKIYENGIQWYRKNFLATIGRGKKQVYFEATPDYIYHPQALARIHQHYPSLKMVLVLRDPVARAFSAWNMERYRFDISLSTKPVADFDVIVSREMEAFKAKGDFDEPSFIKRGLYVNQLKEFYKHFSKDQLLILGAKDLSRDTTNALNSVLKYVGLPDSNWQFLNDKKQNVFGYQHKLSPETRQLLEDFYRSYNEELFQLIGFKPNW